MRIVVRRGRRIILAPRFSRIGVSAPDGNENVYRFAELFALSPRDAIPGRISGCCLAAPSFTGSLKRKENSSRGWRQLISRFVCVATSLYPCPGTGILTRFPFGRRLNPASFSSAKLTSQLS